MEIEIIKLWVNSDKIIVWLGTNAHRSSRPGVFRKKGVLKNFTKFTGKHLCQSLFFNKVAGRPKLLRTPFSIEQLWWLLLYTVKIKIASSLHFLTAQAFLFSLHCGAISTLARNTSVTIFPDKHVSLHSITLIATILVESFMIGYTSFWLKLENYNFIF